MAANLSTMKTKNDNYIVTQLSTTPDLLQNDQSSGKKALCLVRSV